MSRKPLNNDDKPQDVKKGKESLLRKFLAKTKIELANAATLDQSKISNIEEWVSTGSYTLNKVLSGSYNKGLPRGRIVALAGPSGVGKSFVCGNCLREAQKAGFTCVVFDSENAIDKDFLGRIGVNVSEILHVPIVTINEFKFKSIKIMREMHEMDPEAKLFFVMDSIGGLLTEKEYFDQIEQENTAMDMGLRAKQLRTAAKALTAEVAKTKSIMMVTNHTYEQAAANPQAAPIVKMGGGEGFIYATSAVLFLRKSLEKEEKDNLATGKTEKVVKGAILKATTEKNRFVPQGLKGEIYISFDKGVNRWYGLLEDAMEAGFIKIPSVGWYETRDGKKLRKKDLYKSDVWLPMIEDLNKYVENKYKFVSYDEEPGESTDDSDSEPESDVTG